MLPCKWFCGLRASYFSAGQRKAVLQYARDILDYNTLDPQLMRTPRPPSREVVYLNDSELESFLNAIPLHSMWNPEPRFSGVCFRALVETLIATAMRISESLSLNREGVDFDKREAVIIGKWNKQRVVFFTPRAISRSEEHTSEL